VVDNVTLGGGLPQRTSVSPDSFRCNCSTYINDHIIRRYTVSLPKASLNKQVRVRRDSNLIERMDGSNGPTLSSLSWHFWISLWSNLNNMEIHLWLEHGVATKTRETLPRIPWTPMKWHFFMSKKNSQQLCRPPQSWLVSEKQTPRLLTPIYN
jgi:hypothetical protein